MVEGSTNLQIIKKEIQYSSYKQTIEHGTHGNAALILLIFSHITFARKAVICSLFAIILHSLLRRTFSSQMVRGCFVGSGSEGLQQPEIVSKIIELTKKADPAEIKVAYVGTATYDLETPKTNRQVN